MIPGVLYNLIVAFLFNSISYYCFSFIKFVPVSFCSLVTPLSQSQGGLQRYWTYAVAQGPTIRRALNLIYCSDVATLEVLIIVKQGAPPVSLCTGHFQLCSQCSFPRAPWGTGSTFCSPITLTFFPSHTTVCSVSSFWNMLLLVLYRPEFPSNLDLNSNVSSDKPYWFLYLKCLF